MLNAHDIICSRGGRTLFSGVSFSLKPGESLRLTGPNGIGKSSLLRLLAGLLSPVGGAIERSGRVALADENMALDTDLTLGMALHFWAKLDGADNHSLHRVMEYFQLDILAPVPVRMLSTGQRKRATLARVMASGAPVWLLDEPGNGLDDHSLACLGQAMSDHVKQGGVIVAASHFALPHAFTKTLNLNGVAA
jgi:heme exporter protein A